MQPPKSDPLLSAVATLSQRAVMKFLWLTAALFLVQIVMGVVVAHYGVEGSAFYGIPLAKYVLVARAVMSALLWRDEQRPLLTMFVLFSGAIASFYFAALGYGKHTNLAIAEYPRWWVVHLWVEGFFEVFATVVIAFLFARLGLVGMRSAGRSAVLSATIFLSGGIIGTLHHLYFSGTPTFVIALGSVFSALEVVPLVFVGYEAWENLKASKSQPWIRAYRWPIYFFIAVAFWNLVGAGLFGLMNNPPIALYSVIVAADVAPAAAE